MNKIEARMLVYGDNVRCGSLKGAVRDNRNTGVFIRWEGGDSSCHGDLIEHQSPLIEQITTPASPER